MAECEALHLGDQALVGALRRVGAEAGDHIAHEVEEVRLPLAEGLRIHLCQGGGEAAVHYQLRYVDEDTELSCFQKDIHFRKFIISIVRVDICGIFCYVKNALRVAPEGYTVSIPAFPGSRPPQGALYY